MLNRRAISKNTSEDRDRSCLRKVVFIAFLSIAIGCLYVFIVRPGTYYDEPSHLENVKYYSKYMKMPIMGSEGVSYEALQPPVYYGIFGLLYRFTHFVSEKFAFYAVRISGIIFLIPIVILSVLIVRLAWPKEYELATATALFIALNPAMCSIASSIQNDVLAIVLTLFSIYLSCNWMIEAKLTPHHAFVLGFLVAVSMLTKLTSLFMVVAIPVCAWVLWRRKAYFFILCFLIAIFGFIAWWVVRNQIYYGDPSGMKFFWKCYYAGKESIFSPFKAGDIIALLRTTIADFWLPVEFYRNLIHAYWLRGVVAGLMLFSGIGWLLWYCTDNHTAINNRFSSGAKLAIVYYLICIGVYFAGSVTVDAGCGRMVLPVIVFHAALVCGGGLFVFKRIHRAGAQVYIGILIAALLAANSFVLWQISKLPTLPFHIIY